MLHRDLNGNIEIILGIPPLRVSNRILLVIKHYLKSRYSVVYISTNRVQCVLCTEEKLQYRELEGNETEIKEWFEYVVMGVQKKCKDADETTIDAEILKKMNKDVLCEWLEEVWRICDRARHILQYQHNEF